jgi:hypothetical protein
MRDSGALTELLLTRLKNVEVPIARWLILHKPLAEGNVVFPQIIKIATPETARCGGPYDCTPSGEPFEVVGILWWSISRSGLNTRQLTFFSSTAFLTALSRAERTDRPVLTSMKTISISSEPLSLERNQVNGSAQETNVLRVKIKARQVRHNVLRHLSSGNS